MNWRNSVLALSVLVVAIILAFFMEPANQAATPETQSQMEFVPGTKFYVSDKLGIRFRYHSDYPIVVTEEGSKIYLHEPEELLSSAQSIEVFDKSPGVTLEQAIKDRFLINYDENKCYVTSGTYFPVNRPGYINAMIDYPDPTGSQEPFWEHIGNCPAGYAKTNGIQYFMMNEVVPGKYIFLKLGQGSIASDGTPASPDGSHADWSDSIDIFK